jgi:hypothetical protein
MPDAAVSRKRQILGRRYDRPIYAAPGA